MNIGDIVTFTKKTGKYIGEITAMADSQCTVRVLAVEKHPKQGDLHNHRQADVPFFHERNALAFKERTNIPMEIARTYHGSVPTYTDSLKSAIEKLEEELQSEPNDPYHQKSLEALRSLRKDYQLLYATDF